MRCQFILGISSGSKLFDTQPTSNLKDEAAESLHTGLIAIPTFPTFSYFSYFFRSVPTFSYFSKKAPTIPTFSVEKVKK